MAKQINPYKYIGFRTRKIRLEKNIEKSAMAKLLGFTVSEVDAIENGKTKITSDILFDISNILNTEINYFLTGLENDNIKNATDALEKYIETFKFIESLSPKQKQIFSEILDQAYNYSSQESEKK